MILFYNNSQSIKMHTYIFYYMNHDDSEIRKSDVNTFHLEINLIS